MVIQNLALVGGHDQIQDLKQKGKALAKLREGQCTLVVGDQEMMHVAVDGELCHMTIPLGIEEVEGHDGARTVMALANYLRAVQTVTFDLAAFERDKVIPWAPGLPPVLSYTCPLSVFDIDNHDFTNLVAEITSTRGKYEEAFRDASTGESLAKLCRRFDVLYLLEQFAKRVKERRLYLVPVNTEESHEPISAPIDLTEQYSEARPAFLEAKTVRVTSETVSTSIFKLVSCGRAFESEVSHTDVLVHVNVRVAKSVPDPEAASLALAGKCLEDERWRDVTAMVDPLHGRVLLHMSLAVPTESSLDQAASKLRDFLAENLPALCSLAGIDTNSVGVPASASDLLAPGDEFIAQQRLSYRFQRACLLAGALHLKSVGTECFFTDDHSIDISIWADAERDALNIELDPHIRIETGTGAKTTTELALRMQAVFENGRTAWKLGMKEGAYRTGDEIMLACVYPLAASLRRDGGYKALFGQATRTLFELIPSIEGIASGREVAAGCERVLGRLCSDQLTLEAKAIAHGSQVEE